MKKLLLVAVLASLAACCPCRKASTRVDAPLAETRWQLSQLDGRVVTPEGRQFTLQFTPDVAGAVAGRVAAMGSCNRMSASYETGEKNALHITMPASTRMACPDMATENGFARMLTQTTHYQVDGQMLLLFSEGDLRAVLQEVAPEPETRQ